MKYWQEIGSTQMLDTTMVVIDSYFIFHMSTAYELTNGTRKISQCYLY